MVKKSAFTKYDKDYFVTSITKILDKIIEDSKNRFKKENDFKVRPGYGYDKFYLTRIEGSYDMSLYGLIHYIMYEEGIYKQFLNTQEYGDLEKTIETEPEGIYRPDYDKNERVNDLLDYIYWFSIEFVAKKLISLDFDVKNIFSELGFLVEEKDSDSSDDEEEQVNLTDDKFFELKDLAEKSDSVDELKKLATDKEGCGFSENDLGWEDIRSAVGENIHCPSDLMELLAKDEESCVRAGVARNENIPESLLEKLASDADIDVKDAVASHLKASPSILTNLAENRDLRLLITIASNDNTPPSVLEKIVKPYDDSAPLYGEESLLQNVASNPNTPVDLLEKLSLNKSGNIRWSVATNDNTPKSILDKLAKDRDKGVRDEVKDRI